MDGKYGKPINLGPKINTSNKEQFPYIASDGSLYFSSDGHPSYGLMDIFVATCSNGVFDEPLNVGYPVNSPYDDFSFIIDPETKLGYFASNRPGGKGSDDIYELQQTKPLIIEDCKQFSEGIVLDEDTSLPIADVKVELYDSADNLVKSVYSNQDGTFKFDLKCNVTYSVSTTKNGYTECKENIVTNGIRNRTTQSSLKLRSLVVIEQEALAAIQLQKEKKMVQEQVAKKLQLI